MVPALATDLLINHHEQNSAKQGQLSKESAKSSPPTARIIIVHSDLDSTFIRCPEHKNVSISEPHAARPMTFVLDHAANPDYDIRDVD
jgi:hypothetical protein